MASGAPHHQPTNSSELQLYRVLERANLLGYYDSFIQQGGDDVQQLCEAGEEEFLEIMALVGMATKPLHVRRLQKALQEWVSNPSVFQQPITSQSGGSSTTSISTGSGSTSLAKWTLPVSSFSPTVASASSSKASSDSASMQVTLVGGYVLDDSSVQKLKEAAEYVLKRVEPLVEEVGKKVAKEIQQIIDRPKDDPQRLTEIRKYAAIYGRFDSKRKTDKQLTQHEASVNEAAAQLCVIDPMYLSQRDKLFPLARQVVRESGYKFKHGHSRAGMSRVSNGEDGPPPKKPKPANSHPYRDSNIVPNPRTVQAELIKIKRQERMNEIQEALKLIKEEQKIIKAKTEKAKGSENLQRVYDLQLELEKLTTQQLVLMTEQTDLIKRQRRSDRYYVAKARLSAEADSGFYDRDDGDGSSVENDNNDNTDSNLGRTSVASSNASSPPHESSNSSNREKGSEVPSYALPPKKNLASTQKILMQHTLFDEGLRLVQQHTLAYDDEYPELRPGGSRKGSAKVKQEEEEDEEEEEEEEDEEEEGDEEGDEEEENELSSNGDDEMNGASEADKAAQSTINAILNLHSKPDPVIKEERSAES